MLVPYQRRTGVVVGPQLEGPPEMMRPSTALTASELQSTKTLRQPGQGFRCVHPEQGEGFLV